MNTKITLMKKHVWKRFFSSKRIQRSFRAIKYLNGLHAQLLILFTGVVMWKVSNVNQKIKFLYFILIVDEESNKFIAIHFTLNSNQESFFPVGNSYFTRLARAFKKTNNFCYASF